MYIWLRITLYAAKPKIFLDYVADANLYVAKMACVCRKEEYYMWETLRADMYYMLLLGGIRSGP